MRKDVCSPMVVGAVLTVLGAMVVFAADQPPGPPQPFRYNAKGHRDPFIPLVRNGRLVPWRGGSLDPTKPVLQGILWDPRGRSYAMINDAEVMVGETVDSYRVVEIRQDAVVLADEMGERVVLQIEFETPSPDRSPRTTTGGEGR